MKNYENHPNALKTKKWVTYQFLCPMCCKDVRGCLGGDVANDVLENVIEI